VLCTTAAVCLRGALSTQLWGPVKTKSRGWRTGCLSSWHVFYSSGHWLVSLNSA
jgi:hypothetical protein